MLLTGILAFCLLPSIVKAQRQDTLKEVRVEAEGKNKPVDVRQDFSAGQQVQQIEKNYRELYQTQSLANLLTQQTPVFVKSYGINGIATLSFRGASAAQSSVLWNGVPILNPALGVADVSLLSTGLFDRISLQYGSSSALYGSGNVGGALLLEQSEASFLPERQIKATIGGGSFGRRDINLKAQYQNRRWRVGLRAFYQYARNNFHYLDEQQVEKELNNAKLEAGGLLLNVDRNLAKEGATKEHALSLQLWYQQYLREIPPALFEQSSVKQQKDASYRSLLHWRKQGKRSHYYAKFSLNREDLRYRDGVVLPDNRNHVYQYYQELGWKYRLDAPGDGADEHLLLLYAPMQYAVAKGENIGSTENQFRPAMVAAYSYSAWGGRLKANAALRQEWVNGNAAPLLPGIGADFYLLKQNTTSSALSLQLQANLQRTYRIPTLNELYYFPGGNRNLKPEQGWNMDGGYVLKWAVGKMVHDDIRPLQLEHQVHGFNRNIKDWIYWLGGAIWTPYNIAEVHSRGMETDNTLSYHIGAWKLHAGVKYAYVLSTTVSSYMPNDGSAGKQIPYAPRYNGQSNLGFSYKGLFVNYNHTYTGYRFTTVDESQYLMPYQTGNVQVMYAIQKNEYSMRLSAQVQNVWNEDYEVVNARPMPGRYFLLSLQVGWQR